MVLFSSDGLCLDDHERTPNDVYWHGKREDPQWERLKLQGFCCVLDQKSGWATIRESEKLPRRVSSDEAEEF